MTTPATQLPPRTKPKKPFYKKWWGILLIIIVILTLIGVAAMLLAPSKKVPDVVGKTYGEAQKILDDAGFSSVTPQPKDGEIILAVSSAEVVAQDPKPGATVKVTTQIKLTISRANIEKKEKAAEARLKPILPRSTLSRGNSAVTNYSNASRETRGVSKLTGRP